MYVSNKLFLIVEAFMQCMEVWKIGLSFFVLLLSFLLVAGGKCIHRRVRFNSLLPGVKFSWYNPLGHLYDLFSSELLKKGFSVNAALMQLMQDNVALFHKHKLFAIWFSYVPVVIFVKAEAVEMLYKCEDTKAKNWSSSLLKPILSTGLLTSTGNKWKSRRKLLNPCFHPNILKDFIPIFNEQALLLVKCLEKQSNGDFMKIGNTVGQCVLEILLETIFGVKIGAQEKIGVQYVQSAKRMQKIAYERITNVFYWSDLIFSLTKKGKEAKIHMNYLKEFTRKVMQEKKEQFLRKKSPENTKSKRKALMDFLIEKHLTTHELSDEDVREEVDSFVAAGLGTTSASICWTLYLIGLHEDLQNKIHEELDNAFGKAFDSSISADDLKELKYIDRVLKESKRLYPPAPCFGKVPSEDLNISGYTIPKEATCFVMPYFIHRDEDAFPNAEKFDPDRFLPENCAKRHPYAYLPFSAGPRNCIGSKFSEMEEKIIISMILRNFVVESVDQRDKVPSLEITLRPAVPIQIKFLPR